MMGEPRNCRRNCAALPASRIRSSSSSTVFSYSATTSTGRRRRPSSEPAAKMPATAYISSRSLTMRSRMPGRSTFTTTASPVFSTAPWTCASEAAPSGSVSNSANSSPTGAPRAASIRSRAWSTGNGGTRSCSFASSSARSAGSRSRRVDSACPNLMKMGPSVSNASRRRSARVPAWRRTNQVHGDTKRNHAKRRSNRLPARNSSKPYSTVMRWICTRRRSTRQRDTLPKVGSRTAPFAGALTNGPAPRAPRANASGLRRGPHLHASGLHRP